MLTLLTIKTGTVCHVTYRKNDEIGNNFLDKIVTLLVFENSEIHLSHTHMPDMYENYQNLQA